MTTKSASSPKDPVPIDLGDDPLVRLKNLLILIAEAVLAFFPNLIIIIFTIFLAVLALLAFFSHLLFQSDIPQPPIIQ
ncbi:hypothetical protein A3F03_01035 [Candidatus Roizmanbacteria bacterium RIFCSPHIGHO2_12_FULL_41_11]|uniref:Uncharacterized protein n=3 Tax=Candidatus Roizmaniibacteriota TaxID=1752723 RepID=A0A1F7JRY9_9BACT|nr:MAG: hypothetical protein A3F03_01035 [Candidatus Roizmanbacteria bacterium RIFCSPHIGHO2_12_FULL_41_11]OGK52242.1 MAG: hypothetical protein A2966_02475 [Candidatus Roizmanbacteria bacterium RIFCSPLOWO2_01_FULL_41_22]OGK58364.1 MAG: hypothetical protein A3H86_00240 [Candidatus Roizmanbacteria bacterium RIFCSPLOWO2_02_FULL_41_9]